jgi:polysaccharide chain length determinant protein (PEP-CTERM system associated)
MIENRELTMDDYLAMLRRRAKVILIPTLLAPLIGFGISYFFTAKYTSQSQILVEGQKVPETMVQPVVTEDLTARVATLAQQILSQGDLQPVVERLGLARGGRSVPEVIDEIRSNTSVSPVDTTFTQIGAKPKPGQSSDAPSFNINYTASNPREAQQVCNELTSLLVEENLKSIQAAAAGTSDVLNSGIEDAKRNLDDMDGKLAAFKKQYVGQLPGDEDSNLKILTGLNAQLEANTQTLNRAQQDKAYTESVLATQLAAWRGTETSNPVTLQKQLSDLQSQLVDLKAKYTDDHPDVIKTKADIEEVKRKLAEADKAAAEATDIGNDKASPNEPPEIRQMRIQVHQYNDLIAAATRDQKHLQQEIGQYEGRISLSPAIEEQYKELTRDYDNANKSYQDLLAKKSSADLTVKMNNDSQGERMFPLNPASLPDAPSFPNRWYFAGGGLGVGLGLGLGLVMWFELRDKSIRNEADAEAVLQLPMLVAVPWVGAEEVRKYGNGKWGKSNGNEVREKVGV